MARRATPIIVGVFVLALVVGALYVLLRPKSDATFDQPTTSHAATPAPSTPNPIATTVPTPGTYIPYTENDLQAATTRRVLFFHAQWCPQCRNLEKTILAQGVPQGMTIFKVDYDHSQSLRQKYGVTLQTTFVEVDSQGNLKNKYVAYNKPTIDAVVEALGK